MAASDKGAAVPVVEANLGERVGRDPRMEVLCACDERYLPHAATMLCSLLERNAVRIHLFYSGVAHSELTKLGHLVGQYSGELVLYEIVANEFRGLDATVAAYYRLLAPRLLPLSLDRIIYLDCDIIVRRSLAELWNIDIAGCALAAVPDLYSVENGRALGLPGGTKYFNSGVILMNLNYWRRNDISEKVLSLIRRNPEQMGCWEQDGLNALLINQWIELPGIWNCQMDSWRTVPFEAEDGPAIVHFFTDDKPWFWANKHPFKDEYRKYRLKTPWFRYKEEGAPHLLKRFAGFPQHVGRAIVPRSVRRWVRSVILKLQA